MRKRLAAIASVALGCAASAPPRAPVTVVVRGDAAEVSRARAALAASPPRGIEVRPFEPPPPRLEETGPGDLAAALDKVRAAYDLPSWEKCMAPIADPALVPALLAAGRRDGASRVLFWRAACLLLKGDEAGARVAARELAVRGLDLPSEKSDPAVPRLLADVALDVSRQQPITVRVTSAGPELVVSFDGRHAVCTTPCPIPARPGPHTVRVDGDGRSPVSREVSVEHGPVEARFDPPAASPDLAARQWVTRWSSSPAVDSAPSLHLLADATRARDLALMVIQGGKRPSVRAALLVDGVVRARTEKEGARGDDAPALLRELLVEGHVIESSSVLKKPLFWIAIVAVAGAAAGLTAYLTNIPHTATVRPP